MTIKKEYTNEERLRAIRELLVVEGVRLGAGWSDIIAGSLAAESAFNIGNKSAYASLCAGIETIKRRMGVKS